MRLPRPVIFLSVFAAVVLVIVAVSALLLPWLIDSQLIKNKISSEFAKNTVGSVIFDKIAFQRLPPCRRWMWERSS
jgi:hypothetical protein